MANNNMDNSPIKYVYGQVHRSLTQDNKRKLERIEKDRVRAWSAFFTVIRKSQIPLQGQLADRNFQAVDPVEKKAIVSALRREIEALTCAICMEEPGEVNGICITSCSHFFCDSCIKKQEELGRHSCPICRKEMTCVYREEGKGEQE